MHYYDPKIHHRRSLRLKGFDYSRRGLYFVTNCCQNFDYLFGDVINGEMIPNEAGLMVEKIWLALPERFPNIRMHGYVVMPNHFHAILEICEHSPLSPLLINPTAGSTLVVDQSSAFNRLSNNNDNSDKIDMGQPQGLPGQFVDQRFVKVGKTTVGIVLDAFKSITTVEYIRGVKRMNWKPFYKKVWQREYFDTIIYNEEVLDRITRYIGNNPIKWRNDKFHSSI